MIMNSVSNSSSSPTSKLQAIDRARLEDWGTRCSLPNCNLLDFLPFSCPECSKSFCSNHFKPSLVSSDVDHLCEKFILRSENQSSSKPGSLPKKVDEPQTNRKLCSYNKCKTIMLAPIQCPSCQRSYCPTHRLAQDHLCTTSHSTIATTSSSSTKDRKNSHTNNPINFNPIKNYFSSPTTHPRVKPRPSSPATTPSSNSSTHPPRPDPLNPIKLVDDLHQFSLNDTLFKFKSNQRNKSELESQQKALEFRIKNGLLTDRDRQEIQKRAEARKHTQPSMPSTKDKSQKANHPSSSDCCIV